MGGKGTSRLAVAPVRVKLAFVVRPSDVRLGLLEKLSDFAKDMPDENVSMWLLYACAVEKGKAVLRISNFSTWQGRREARKDFKCTGENTVKVQCRRESV